MMSVADLCFTNPIVLVYTTIIIIYHENCYSLATDAAENLCAMNPWISFNIIVHIV